MILIIDGPEKAGKSTIIAHLRELSQEIGLKVEVRAWGPVYPDDRIYTPKLQQDVEKDNPRVLTIWDRSWASEYVYGNLLGRDRRLSTDPWLGEWLHGRVTPNKVMILTDPEMLRMRRDDTDLPVDPVDEYNLYAEYADRFGWLKVKTEIGSPRTDALTVLTNLEWTVEPVGPPNYCGPTKAPVVFVGDRRSERDLPPGAWLPFTSRLTTLLGRELGDDAMKCGWTNAHEIPPQQLRNRKCIVSCGKNARMWVDHYVIDRDGVHINIPHPAWLYRFKNEKTAAALATAKLELERVRGRYLS